MLQLQSLQNTNLHGRLAALEQVDEHLEATEVSQRVQTAVRLEVLVEQVAQSDRRRRLVAALKRSGKRRHIQISWTIPRRSGAALGE